MKIAIKKIPVAIVRFPIRVVNFVKVLFRDWLWQISTFSLLLLGYLGSTAISKIISFRFTPGLLKPPLEKLNSLFLRLLRFLNGRRNKTINRVGIVEIAIRNMLMKKSRAFVTVGGMALGIGAIVYLVSLGYGINRLVVTRVARLEEMVQADVTPQTASQIRITDETLAQFDDIENLEQALPMIAVVAKIEYQNSRTDMAVYGVTADYLKQSAIQPVHGKLFDSNELVFHAKNEVGQVAGVSTSKTSPEVFSGEIESGQYINQVEVRIEPDQWLRVRTSPNASSPLLGYTQRDGEVLLADEVWGGPYISNSGQGRAAEYSGKTYGKWIESRFRLWEEQDCSAALPEDNCQQFIPIIDESGKQKIETGYVAQLNMTTSAIDDRVIGAVLGLTSDDETVEPTGEVLAVSEDGIIEDGEWVEIASESALLAGPTVQKIDISDRAKKEAVVNRAMLTVLGISEDQAVGTTFSTSFQVVGNLLNQDEQVESVPTDYTIVGVIPEDSAPFFYVPFLDLRSLGITNYSQVKVVAANQDSLPQVRRLIESLGFTTNSVADTVEQIDSLFATLRSVLALLGMVALAVAALGMFNTLTVSLLERTREVGLMKAMGMKSDEVRELFLTESMIMGFFGGILGISLGYAAGKLTSLLISAYAISQGQGFIDVSHIPSSFILVVFGLSLIVGIFTGVYPARRATKISALDALRYE